MLLQAEAIGLAGLTIALAGPVSASLARARWPRRAPRPALFLWQAVGLGGGLGILTAGLTLAAGDVGQRWLAGVVAIPSHSGELDAWGWFGVGLTACVGAWLVTVTAVSAARVLAARRAHRRRLNLIADALRVGSPDGADRSMAVHLVDHPLAVAYCVPGLRPRVVLSRGAVQTLADGELAAVLAHERAHARGHHDLVLQPFLAWAKTFPFLPTARRAVAAVDLLVEMLADDAALRRCTPTDLRSALHSLGDAEPAGARDDDSGQVRHVAARIARLSAHTHPLRPWVRVWIYVAAVALVVLPPALLVLS